jgi:hypothetical protein
MRADPQNQKLVLTTTAKDIWIEWRVPAESVTQFFEVFVSHPHLHHTNFINGGALDVEVEAKGRS